MGAVLLPALVLAVISLGALYAGRFGVFVSAAAWLGTLGLVRAGLNRPADVDWHPRLATAALLMSGLLAVAPLLLWALLEPLGGTLVVLAVTAGPILSALHYVWQAGRVSTAGERRVLAAVLIGMAAVPVMVYLVKPSPPRQVIHESARTDEITLVVDADAGLEKESMGLLYIAKLPYRRINFAGRAYTPIAPRAQVSVPWDGTPSRYVVTERVRKNPRSDWWPIQVIWTLRDQQTGKVMARRELWRNGSNEWSNDTPRGWQGDHAARFVQEVLQPSRTWPGNIHRYPLVNARIERVAAEGLTWEDTKDRVSGCNGRVESVGKGADSYVQSVDPDWRFKPETSVDRVFCIGPDIYVVSGSFTRDFDIDKLGSDGYPVDQFQIYVREGSTSEDYFFRYISSFSAGPNGVSMLVDFISPRNPGPLRRADLTLKISTE